MNTFQRIVEPSYAQEDENSQNVGAGFFHEIAKSLFPKFRNFSRTMGSKHSVTSRPRTRVFDVFSALGLVDISCVVMLCVGEGTQLKPFSFGSRRTPITQAQSALIETDRFNSLEVKSRGSSTGYVHMLEERTAASHSLS